MKKLIGMVLLCFYICIVQLPSTGHAESRNVDLPFGKEVTSYITEDVDTEYYRVKLDEPGLLSVTVSSYVSYLDVEIYDEDNDKVMGNWDFSGANNVNPIPWKGSEYLEAGKYTIRVAKESNQTGKYKLKASFTAANNNEKEPNNGQDLAQKLALNSQKVMGLISWNDNVDYYHVKLNKAGLFSIELSSYMKYLDVEMFDEDNDKIMNNWDFTGANYINPITWKKSEYLEPGNYTIKVAMDSNYTGKYKIKTTFTAANNNEKESNNGRDLAQRLTPNTQKITGLISWNDTVDYYQVKLNKAGLFSINLSSYMNYLDVEVFNENNEKIMGRWDFTGANINNPIPWTNTTNLSKGTYIIKISMDSGYTGKYKLAVSVPHLLPKEPQVNKVKKNSTRVTGASYKNSTVYVKIGSKTYTGKSNNLGKFSIKIAKAIKGKKVYVSVKTAAGKSAFKVVKVS
ncbi:hypothetical protein BK128_04620 [Viridibacillus sp. FSL H7-0596]|uniref:Ig-like domain-containing protein n=1 Tax=Viridibacillus sp. FSL H7-0596 TaxID=1928923 RepID=UPI00096F017F|nr:Ig-like domain-containing protein [Viridibacillus sp. FSL H7-0596]OMC89211.1 hypothetical protein BK128_04620 [Viridibacillus sp. FSL H7-0596]